MKLIIAMIQLVIHYLAILGMVMGGVAIIFGNTSRGIELLIGGIRLMVFKYLVGIIYLGLVWIVNRLFNR